MAARHSPYTNLNYETDIRREGREWNSIPKLEDLRKGHELVQSFSEGRLHLSSPLVFTQAGRRSFDGHFLGAALLGELLASDVVYWLELPPEPLSTRIYPKHFIEGGQLEAAAKLEAAQALYFKVFHQLPNAFCMSSGRDASQHAAWLRDSSPCARHQQRNAGAANLPSGAKGMPIRILHDPIAREGWLLDGESDPSTGCQQIIMLGPTVYAGSLERIFKLAPRRFVERTNKEMATGCRKSYWAFDNRALAKECQMNTSQDLAVTLQDLYSTADREALMTWGAIRGIMARLRRLSHILSPFRYSQTRKADWRLPSDLQALLEEVESITQELTSGPLNLGRDILQADGAPTEFKDKPVHEATPDGAKTEEVLDQFLPKGSKSEGQGRKRLRSETKDSQGESRGQRRKQRVRSDTKDNEELTVHEENEDGGSMDNEA